MKTWLILVYLATTVISNFAKEVTDDRIREAETPLPPQDAGMTEEPEKGYLSWFLSFLRKDAGRTEESELHQNPNTDSRNLVRRRIIKKMPKFRFVEPSGKPDEDNAGENINTMTEGQKEGSHEKEETTNLNVTSNEIQGEEEDDGITTACKQTNDLGVCIQECLNATELSATALITAKPATTPTIAETTTGTGCLSKNCQAHSNPWAACTHPTPEDDAELSEALNEFAVEIYKTTIQHEQNDSNFIFSPISISTMLSNLLLGACNETKDRLERLLFYSRDFTCVHKALKSLSKSDALISANAIFYQPALALDSDFLNQSETFYRTKFSPLTENINQDVVEINAWVSKNTNYKIKKLLDELDPDVQMVLLNAVYFRSKWKTVFKLKNTKDEEFYRPGLPAIKVPMMTSKKYPVASFFDSNLQAKVARLQLFNNLSLVIMVPRSLSQNLSEVEGRLSATVFRSVLDKLEHVPFKPTILTLPKFKVESSRDLMALIQEMDYGIFFDANLCGISQDEEVAVSGAQHKAMMEISEEGVEAAATTGVSLARTANFFEVQQPFLFSLLKDMKGVIFMGRISNPQP